jgi:hypothetical protein
LTAPAVTTEDAHAVGGEGTRVRLSTVLAHRDAARSQVARLVAQHAARPFEIVAGAREVGARRAVAVNGSAVDEQGAVADCPQRSKAVIGTRYRELTRQ